MSRLPIEDVLPEISRVLRSGQNAVLTAPPGAGKTTRVPLMLLDEPWMTGKKLLLLEPRRLAARAAAHRMATMVNELVGATVGYRMRMETKVGPQTRIEVVTEGVLTRLLQSDPALDGYAAILFDEFHERSLHGDTGLTLSLETQRLFRADLRLLVMSATLECGPVSDLLDHAPTIRSDGRMFPIETRYLDHPIVGHLEPTVTQTIRRSLSHDHGSILVFLPGMAEIRRVEQHLLDAQLGTGILIAPLHGDLPQTAQTAAIEPPPSGTRKVVLATSIAETSLTIDGIRVVIDAGQQRMPRFDPRSGLTRLETVRVSQDSADQRRGRAGRLEPGICYRLWTEQEQRQLSPRRPPEILEADLAPLLLDLAQWGTVNPAELSWLTPPPAGSLGQAKELLTALGALDQAGCITPHGKRMADLPLHPRLAHMLVRSQPLKLVSLACDLAALLGERDLLQGTRRRQADLRLRLDALQGDYSHLNDTHIDRAAGQRVTRNADHWRRQLREKPTHTSDHHGTGVLLALAYPDRIAQRQDGAEPRYLLANGRGALFTQPDPLATERYLVIADLDAGAQWARIDLAAPIDLTEIESLYADHITERELVTWDEPTRSVKASRQRTLGAMVLSDHALSKPDPSLIVGALLKALRRAGLTTLAWTPELTQWRARVQFLRQVEGADWPDLSDARLTESLETWLGPSLYGITSLERVQSMALDQPLYALLSWNQQRDLDRLAPTHLTVPSGSRVRIDYDTSHTPVLAVRLQELFGCTETPRVVNKKVPLMLHLLSPAKRPVQVTQDLAGFWARAYHDVRKELRGRYPKHHWPEDPLNAMPTAKAKRREE